MKQCSNCLKNKSLDCFYKNNKSNDGLQYICKVCDSAKRRQHKQLKRKAHNAANYKYKKKRQKTNPEFHETKNLRNRLQKALNKDKGDDKSCLALFGKSKEDFELYLWSHHKFGMDAARGYIKHPPQPQFKPDPLTDNQRLHFVEQRNSILTYDHTVCLKNFDLRPHALATFPELSQEQFQKFNKKFKRYGHAPQPIPTLQQRFAFSYLNTRRMWSICNFKKGTDSTNMSKEQLVEKFLRTNPYT